MSITIITLRTHSSNIKSRITLQNYQIAMRVSRVVSYSLGAAASSFVGTTLALNGASNLSSAFISTRGEVLRKIADTAVYASLSTNNPSNNINKDSTTKRNMSSSSSEREIDTEYPGTAVERMLSIRERVKGIPAEEWNGSWEDVRRRILWAGGLRDLPDAEPGQGYTGHSFNDFNHVDLTAMRDYDNENDGSVKGIAIGNFLGDGIRIASLPEVGSGGSWSTCAIGCNKDPPQDVAHVQFKSRIAFKLVWADPKNNDTFDTFVLVDDEGKLLAKGKPSSGVLPSLRERVTNYKIVAGSKYAIEADKLST